jgi:hypothetical protein
MTSAGRSELRRTVNRPNIPYVKLFLVLSLSGCYQEIADLASQPSPGGAVQAALNGSAMKQTTALAEAKAEPLTIEGGSADLTVSLIAVTNGTAITPLQTLAQPSVAMDLLIDSQNTAEIHMNQTGCIATQGTMHFETNTDLQISGNFSGTGVVPGTKTVCSIAGTLTTVPADR